MAHVTAAGSRAVVIAENGEPAHSFIAHDIRQEWSIATLPARSWWRACKRSDQGLPVDSGGPGEATGSDGKKIP